jgi:DNA-binding NarL/FixJ family response regulator
VSAVRVVVADDHPVFRAGLRALLQSSPGVEVVGEAGDGSQALALASELAPDVLILDIEMAGMNGIEVARRLREAGSPVRVLVLSAYDDEAYILQALAQGAAGYLTKEEAEEVVAEAVLAVARGQEGWLSRSATAKIVRIQRDQARAGERLLSDREREVLLLLARGEGNK